MSFKKPFILAICAMPFIAACTSKQSSLPPLAPVTSSVPVNTVWYKHINASTKIDFTKFTPAVDGSQLFASDVNGDVGSFQLNNGSDNWRTRLKKAASGGVAVGGGAVYVPTVNGELYALNEQNGAVLWHVTLPDQSNTAATYANGQVYVKTIDGKLVALNASNGQTVWTYDEGATELQLLGSSRAVVSGNTVIAGFSDGKVDAINANNGQLIWQTIVATPQGFSDVSQMVGVFADPVISGNAVYVASYHGTISALDLSSGRMIWQHPISNYAGIAVDDDSVFATNTGGTIFAYSKDDGTVLWKQSALHGRELSGPAINGSNIVLGDNEGNVHWLSEQDGHFTARTFVGKSPIAVTPLVVSGNVIVLSQNGNVFVLRLAA